ARTPHVPTSSPHHTDNPNPPTHPHPRRHHPCGHPASPGSQRRQSRRPRRSRRSAQHQPQHTPLQNEETGHPISQGPPLTHTPSKSTKPASHGLLNAAKFRKVGLDRLELSTSPLSGVRSNQLSYRPGGALALGRA